MKILTWIIVVALIIFGIYWVINRDNTPDVTNNYTSEDNSQNNTQSTTTINVSPTPPTSTSTGTSVNVNVNTTVGVSKTVTVNYTGSGFSPKSVTIKKGDTVKFVNQSQSSMWVGVDFHPSHTQYDGTNLQTHCVSGVTPSFDSCKNVASGGSYSFTFDKVGTWAYHNHSSATHTGTVVAE